VDHKKVAVHVIMTLEKLHLFVQFGITAREKNFLKTHEKKFNLTPSFE